MPKLSAPHWNEKDGVCTRHMLPQIPCLQCAAEENTDVEVRFTEEERDIAVEDEIPLRHLAPAPFAYLVNKAMREEEETVRLWDDIRREDY